MKKNIADLELKEKVSEIIERVRPYINHDGGEIELVDIKDGLVYVKLGGACEGCDLIEYTLYDGLEVMLVEEVPGVIGVVLANDLIKEEV